MTERSEVDTDRQAYFAQKFRIIGLLFLCVGLATILYSAFYLLASLDQNFVNGKFDVQGLTANYSFWMASSISMITFGVLTIRLANDPVHQSKAKAVSLYGKI